MVFDRAQILAEGGVYHGVDNPLVECASFVADKITFESVASTGLAPAVIKEDANLPKRMVIEGVFQRFMPADGLPENFLNANKRIYTMERVGKKVLDPAGDVQKRISERAMIGHVEHPTDGTTDLLKGAILVTKVWAENDGTVKGRAIVYNNPPGQMIQEYVTTGTKIGISSRGTGTVDARGYVCEDYALETWDIVYNPSTTGAHPTLKTESVAPEQVVQEAVVKPAVESSSTSVIIPSQDNPMSLSKRISEVRSEVSSLLAVDPRKLTVEAREKYVSALIDTRVKLAEEFTGEKRAEIAKILEAIDSARKTYEDAAVTGWRDSPLGVAVTTGPASGVSGAPADAAVTGQVDQGVPGTWDALSKVLGIPCTPPSDTADRAKGWAETQATLGMIANWYGRGGDPAAVKSAMEALVAGKTIMVEGVEETKSLLRAARDEIIHVTEREEAASAIITELRTQFTVLQGKVTESQAAAAKASEIIADLTSVDRANQGKVVESATAPVVPVAAPRKSLAERLAERANRIATEGLPSGTPVASRPDASEAAKIVANGDAKALKEDRLLGMLASTFPKLNG